VQFRVFDDEVAVLPIQPNHTAAGVVICRSDGIVAAQVDRVVCAGRSGRTRCGSAGC